MINFNPFPIIETKRLLLRRITIKDTNDLYHMRRDPRMNEFVDTKVDTSIIETQVYIEKINKGVDENKWIIWAIEHKEASRVIGTICIWNINEEQNNGELGYGIIPEFQGQGLMKEALLNVVNYCFIDMGFKSIDAYTEEKNSRSIKLLESSSFNEINRVDDEGFYSNRVYHMIVYRLTSKISNLIK